MPLPLQVDYTDERMVFNVHSRTNPAKTYRVDLLAHGGIGECACPNWRTQRWPIIRDGGRSLCIHVEAARRQFVNDLLERMAREELSTEHHHHR